jgi:hypothetical protein
MDLDTSLKIIGDTLIFKVKHLLKPKIKFNIINLPYTFFGVEKMALPAGSKVKVVINPTDQFGNRAKVDGIPLWSVSDEAIATLEVAEDGLSSVFTSVGPVGTVTVEVTADADMSEGIRNLGGSVVVDIEAGEAIYLGAHIEPIVVDVTPVDTTPVDSTPIDVPADTVGADTAPVDVPVDPAV